MRADRPTFNQPTERTEFADARIARRIRGAVEEARFSVPVRRTPHPFVEGDYITQWLEFRTDCPTTRKNGQRAKCTLLQLLLVLLVDIRVRNIGNVPVRLLPGRSFTFSLKRLPDNRVPGTFLHWNDGEYIVRDLDIVQDANPDHQWSSEDYWLEPGAEYCDLIPVTVPHNAIVMAEVSLKGRPDIDIWAYGTWSVAKD